MIEQIKLLSEKYYENTKEIRRLIHMYPETGFLEIKTSKIIIDELKKLDLEIITLAKTGVVALLRGKYPGKTVLLRADMDGLKLEEKSDVEYKSKVKGMMHACGHDGHVAGLIGAAYILNELKDNLHGNVKFVFQPAEEQEGGAKPMIEEGVLDNPKVDAAFGAHLWGPLKEGVAGVKSKELMASPDIFKFKVIGRGGHGAMPHMSIDPITLTCQIINSLQTIVSRRVSPLDTVVVSFGSINGGDCHNVIPNEVEVEGTVRTFKDESRKLVPKLMEDIIKGITSSQEASYEFNYEEKYPAVINDEKMTELAKTSLKKILGESNVRVLEEANMGGEDFSYFGREVPSSFFFVGIAKDESKPVIHHNPYFEWDDKNIKVLSKGLAQIAVDYLNN